MRLSNLWPDLKVTKCCPISSNTIVSSLFAGTYAFLMPRPALGQVHSALLIPTLRLSLNCCGFLGGPTLCLYKALMVAYVTTSSPSTLGREK